MELKEISDKDLWENFLNGCSEKTFLQSWNWGEFNLKLGNEIWRIGVYNDKFLIAVVLVIKISAKRGTFLLIPHGPAFIDELTDKDKKIILELLIERIKYIAGNGIDFIRISTLLPETEGCENILLDLGFLPAPMHSSTYDATLKLDISQPADKILANMRKTTRYLIKKASVDSNIIIERSREQSCLKIFQELNKKVAQRQKFVPFSDEFIEKEFNSFSRDDSALIFIGKYMGEVACGALIIFWSGIAFYHQAASLSEFSKFSIPYLLQWEAIKEAKRRKCQVYDFWGFIDPKRFPRHPWAGPTLFKMGFGGYCKKYVKAHDLPLTNKYWFNYIIEKIRKFKRGL